MVWVLDGNSLIAAPLNNSVKPVFLELVASRDTEFHNEEKGNLVYLAIQGKDLCIFCEEFQGKPTLQLKLQGSQDTWGMDTCRNILGIHICANLEVRGSWSMGTLEKWRMGVDGGKEWESSLQHHHLREKDRVSHPCGPR
ncbi:interleukin-36 beta isoform X1 [Microcebus murinus]|uniref:interleukin-36 beta isoform X1 n=1 Tax=Microcebus murinus TaxID=30608 RepID=UPI003F6AE912